MAFFKFAFKQSEKGLGKVFLFSLLLAFITTVSIIVVIAKGVADMGKEEFLDEYESTYNCKIEYYLLTCNEDEYDFGTSKIDLNYEGNELELGYDAILTKTGIISNSGQVISYQDLFSYFEISDSSFTIMDAIELINIIMPTLYVFIFVFVMIALFIAFPLGNLLVALVVKGIINSNFKTKFDYKTIYKITIVTTIPYVLFNALCRMIFNFTLSDKISVFLLAVLVDYAIIYGLTYLAVKEGLKDKPVETVNEVIVENNQSNFY